MKAILSNKSLLFLLLFSCWLVSGCGQSGVLYLPEQPQDNQTQSSKQPEQETQQKEK
jgi:predicted small lipoprotein YifL